MPKWIKDGGWVLILAVFIFLAYCTFYLIFKQIHKPKESYVPAPYRSSKSDILGSFDLLTFKAYASDEFDESGDYPELGTSLSDNPVPAPDDAPHVEEFPDVPMLNADSSGESLDIEINQEPDEIPEINESDTDVLGLENEIQENGSIIEEFEPEMSISEISSEYTTQDEIAILTDIRDTLNLLLHIILLCIASAIAYFFIFKPLWFIVR